MSDKFGIDKDKFGIDQDKFEIDPNMQKVVKDVGGAFKLTSLLQKRMKMLNEGAQKLVDMRSVDLLKIAFAEVAEGKITLDLSEEESTKKPLPKKKASTIKKKKETAPIKKKTTAAAKKKKKTAKKKI